MKKLLFIIKRIPLLFFVLSLGILARIISLGFLAGHGEEYSFTTTPIYTVLLDRISAAVPHGDIHKITEQAQTDSVVSEGQSKKDAHTHNHTDRRAKLESISGYVSADREAKILKKPLRKVIEKRKKDSNNTYIYADEYPREALRPVLKAKNYGPWDEVYTDPKGTKYDYPDGGVFKQNHDYYCFQEVGDDYFKNALFIGDSLTDGMHEYGGFADKASFFSMESLTVYNIFDVVIPFRTPMGTVDASLEAAMAGKGFAKIYICLGLNEMGVPHTKEFRQQYEVVVKRIRKLQPKAIIYIQGILHVNEERSKGDPVYNNRSVVQRNEAISKLANGHDIFYLEPSEALCDKNGNMINEYTNDGVHPTATYYALWHAYLNQYAIVRDKEDR